MGLEGLNSGIASGSLFNAIGNYEQCHSIASFKYCLAELHLKPEAASLNQLTGLSSNDFYLSGRTAKLGLCAPVQCRSNEILGLTNHLLLDKFPLSGISSQQIECQEDLVSNGFGLFVSLLIAILFIGFCISATILDSLDYELIVLKGHRFRKLETYTRTFSLIRNYKSLTSKRNRSLVNLSCLDGLRVVSVLWIIVIHSYNFGFQWLMFDNFKEVDNVYKTFGTQWIANGTYSVDNFFFISGLLAWFKAFKRDRGRTRNRRGIKVEKEEEEKQSKLSHQTGTWKQFFSTLVARYMRLIPLLMLMILFSQTLLPKLAFGQRWSVSTRMFDNWCHSNWIWNLLMLQNIIDTPTMCFSHSWYIAADYQLFIFVQMILIFKSYVKNNHLIYILISFCIFAQLLVAGITYIKKLPSLPLIPADSVESVFDYYRLIYIKPYYWLTSYLIGAILASLILVNFKLRARAVFIFQLSALFVMLCIIVSSKTYFQESLKMTAIESSFHSALARPVWSMSLAFLIYLVASRPTAARKNLLERSIRIIFKAKLWTTFARLSYSAYLIHPLVLAAFYGSRTETFNFSHTLLVYFTIGNIFITYLVSLLIHLFFERPIELLLKLVIAKLVLIWETGRKKDNNSGKEGQGRLAQGSNKSDVHQGAFLCEATV